MFLGQFREYLSGKFLIQALKPKILDFKFLGASKFDAQGGPKCAKTNKLGSKT